MFKTSITPDKRPAAPEPAPPAPRPQTAGASNAAMIWTEGVRGAAPRAPGARRSGVLIQGPVSGDCDLRLNGTIVGDVDVTGLTIDEAGSVAGGITADRVEIRGRVVGDVHAAVIKLCARAQVEGDLTYRELSIEPGAHFQGRCTREAPPAPPPEPVAQVAPEPGREFGPEALDAPEAPEIEADAFAIPAHEPADEPTFTH